MVALSIVRQFRLSRFYHCKFHAYQTGSIPNKHQQSPKIGIAKPRRSPSGRETGRGVVKAIDELTLDNAEYICIYCNLEA